jgi:hypothetical protein
VNDGHHIIGIGIFPAFDALGYSSTVNEHKHNAKEND